MKSAEGIHLHPLQAAALTPDELLGECKPIAEWIASRESAEKAATLKRALRGKDAPQAWAIVKDLHLRFLSKDEKTQECLLAWSLLERLQRAYLKWKRCGFPYAGILQPPPKGLEEAEIRCREALLLTISFQPFQERREENETARHCLAYTLLSCLHHDSPSMEGDIKRIKEMAYSQRALPAPKKPPKERLDILTQTMLLVAYGGPITTGEWTRPDLSSVKNLLGYIYDPKRNKLAELIPDETRQIKNALERLNLL